MTNRSDLPNNHDAFSQVLLESLLAGPLLVQDLPEADCFPRDGLQASGATQPLNFQQKLGHLYEQALAVLLEVSPHHDLLARSLQLQKDSHTTVGELDFLIRDTGDGQLIHLELATKFYLAVETEKGLLLPGPDARDNYYRKVQRLRNHQLVLIRKYLSLMPSEFRDEEIVAKQLIYGCLFDHVRVNEVAKPEFVRGDCRRGRWLHLKDLREYFPERSLLEKIPKALWPVSFSLLDEIPLRRWSIPDEVDHCIMLRVNREETPYFIAPDGYPSMSS